MVPTVAVVTGGGRGIGAATSLRLARAGHRILLTYHSDSRSAEEVVEAIRASGTDAVAVKVDCSNRSEVSILAEHPWVISGVAVLVLNHGRYDRQPAATVPFDDLRRTMATNFEGAVHVWNAIHPHLSDESRTVVIGTNSESVDHLMAGTTPHRRVPCMHGPVPSLRTWVPPVIE